MIAGLLFATHDAEDRPSTLIATLPFGGVTLIEYQARLLIEAGAAQIVVVVSRLTPELVGAISRIGRRGVAVDPVRSAIEAAERLHPLAHVLTMADGLVTTPSAIGLLAGQGGDTLLVTDEATADPAFERVGGGLAWAGAALLEARRIVEVARLPRDYDFQATVIRVAAQSPAQVVTLPSGATRSHGIERAASGLERRARAALTATVSDQRGWFDHYLAGPLMRLAMPMLVANRIGGTVIAAVAGLLGVVGLGAIGFGFAGSGLLLALIGGIGLMLGAAIGAMRDEPMARASAIGASVLPGLAVLVMGFHQSAASGDGAARAIAVALVILGALAERAIRPRQRWLVWGSPGAYLMIVTLAAFAGLPILGLGVGALYAAGTLAGAIEDLRG